MSRLEWFIDAWDSPDFTESGWLNYTATVERFDCVIRKEGDNLTVASLSDDAWQETRTRSWEDPEHVRHNYWYDGSASMMVVDGFLVTMEFSYFELYASLGGHGFYLNPQYVIFDHDKVLAVVLLLDGWGEGWV